MARPISDRKMTKFRIRKTTIRDLEEAHWILRKDIHEMVDEAIIDYLDKHTPKVA